MSSHGYASVTNEGFIAFSSELATQTPWKDIPDDDAAAVCASADARCALRADAALKLGLCVAINALQVAVIGDQTTPAEVDPKWDREQRLADLDLSREELSEDPDRVAAAHLIREVMFKGHKTKQTRFTFQEQVDFGRHQASVAQDATVSKALQLLDMTERLARVRDLTEALAAALGRADQAPTLAKHDQRRLARQQCVAAFNAAHNTLNLWSTQATTDTARAHFAALLAPLQALLARHSGKQDPAPTTK
jgi:hypothetical protein